MAKACESCGVCCKLMAIAELDKPRCVLCTHYDGKPGCGIYETRPAPCQGFNCGYLRVAELGPEWRPDRCGFLFWFEESARRIMIEVEPERAGVWRSDPFLHVIRQWARRDQPDRPQGIWEVVVRTGDEISVVFPEAEISLGTEQPEGTIESGYQLVNGRPLPYARYAASA